MNTDASSMTPSADDRSNGLVAWQLEHYPEGHTTRANLVLHVISAPLFCIGTLAVLLAPFTSAWLFLGGALMVLVLVVQGRGHGGEPNRPIPFRGPGDFVARFFVEQWVTFPRFLFGGGFARAWRQSASR